MRISDWSSDVCSSDINRPPKRDSAIGAVTEKTRVVRLVKRRHLFLYAGMNDTERRGPVVVLSTLVVVGNSVVLAARTHLLPQSRDLRSEEHTSELQSLMRISYAVFCFKKQKT